MKKTYKFELTLHFEEDDEPELEQGVSSQDIYNLMKNIHQALKNQANGAGLAISGYTLSSELKAETGEYSTSPISCLST